MKALFRVDHAQAGLRLFTTAILAFAIERLRDLFFQMREHRVQRFLIHIGLELVAVL
jgi:hypothetical protein